MPLTRIRQTAIGNDSITSAKLAHDLDLDGDFVRVPHGTTAQRPSSPVAGYMRFNTDLGTLEQWNTTTNSWQAIDSPPIITSLAYSGSLTAADPAGGETITLTGTNFKSGATVTIGGTSATSVSVPNSTTITFTTPVKTAGDYDIVVTNANGLSATLTNGISYNGTPSFTTAAGNVGSIAEDAAMSTITIVAAEPDGGTLAYSITSGALPTGVSMSSAGAITGTPNVNPTSDTTFNFTVTATDDENQTNARAFNLIVLRPIYATSIDNSLRFNDDDGSYLSWTPAAASNRKTWTYSLWLKRGANITASVQNHALLSNSDGSQGLYLRVNPNDPKIDFACGNGNLVTNALYRDHSAWYHIVAQYDSANSTMKLYVNGEQVTDLATNTQPSLNTDGNINDGNAHYIGRQGTLSRYLDGYLSDVHFIDGQALTPTSFAEEFNGVWAPKAYSGSYGTNGYKLDFADNSAIGNDVSGNNNDWTATNFGTFDVFPDSPTINFCTLNPLIKRRDVSNNVTFYQGNLGAVYPNAGGNQTYSFGTHDMSSGKWYYEVYMFATGSNTTVGIGHQSDIDGTGSDAVLYRNTGSVSTSAGGSKDGDGASYANGDVVGCGFDLDNGTVTFYKNGTLQSTVTGISTTATYMPYVRGTTSEQILTNFGQDSTFSGTISAASNADANGIGNFKYTVPSDHLAICSKNLSESTMNTSLDDRPEDYFDAVTYTGNGGSPGTQSVNIGFQPDFVWLKSRPQTYTNYLFNSLSGNNKHLISDVTNGEATLNGTSEAFTFESTGFQVLATGGSALNESSQGADNMVSWSWKAGGAPTASNVATSGAMTANSVSLNGTLQSAYTPDASVTQYPTKMSINTKTGFSIVSWTGNGSAGTWLPHGLNSTPEMMMLKGLDNRVWSVYHKNLTSAANYLQLNSTNGESADGSMFNSVPPNDKRFVVGSYNVVNNVNYIGYFWHSVPGYSRIGVYQSSGFADGVFVELGFKPAWIMIKSASAGRNWAIWDNVRGHASSVGAGNNPNTTTLFANTNGIETHNAGYAVDFTANGFKTRGQGGELNTTNEKMMFMAFAEDPFKYSEAE
jgi:hypothetical protein